MSILTRSRINIKDDSRIVNFFNLNVSGFLNIYLDKDLYYNDINNNNITDACLLKVLDSDRNELINDVDYNVNTKLKRINLLNNNINGYIDLEIVVDNININSFNFPQVFNIDRLNINNYKTLVSLNVNNEMTSNFSVLPLLDNLMLNDVAVNLNNIDNKLNTINEIKDFILNEQLSEPTNIVSNLYNNYNFLEQGLDINNTNSYQYILNQKENELDNAISSLGNRLNNIDSDIFNSSWKLGQLVLLPPLIAEQHKNKLIYANGQEFFSFDLQVRELQFLYPVIDNKVIIPNIDNYSINNNETFFLPFIVKSVEGIDNTDIDYEFSYTFSYINEVEEGVDYTYFENKPKIIRFFENDKITVSHFEPSLGGSVLKITTIDKDLDVISNNIAITDNNNNNQMLFQTPSYINTDQVNEVRLIDKGALESSMYFALNCFQIVNLFSDNKTISGSSNTIMLAKMEFDSNGDHFINYFETFFNAENYIMNNININDIANNTMNVPNRMFDCELLSSRDGSKKLVLRIINPYEYYMNLTVVYDYYLADLDTTNMNINLEPTPFHTSHFAINLNKMARTLFKGRDNKNYILVIDDSFTGAKYADLLCIDDSTKTLINIGKGGNQLYTSGLINFNGLGSINHIDGGIQVLCGDYNDGQNSLILQYFELVVEDTMVSTQPDTTGEITVIDDNIIINERLSITGDYKNRYIKNITASSTNDVVYFFNTGNSKSWFKSSSSEIETGEFKGIRIGHMMYALVDDHTIYNIETPRITNYNTFMIDNAFTPTNALQHFDIIYEHKDSLIEPIKKAYVLYNTRFRADSSFLGSDNIIGTEGLRVQIIT